MNKERGCRQETEEGEDELVYDPTVVDRILARIPPSGRPVLAAHLETVGDVCWPPGVEVSETRQRMAEAYWYRAARIRSALTNPLETP
jgi:hypothetical protein